MALFKLSYGGQQFGPHTQAEIAAMLADGLIDWKAQVWQEGWPTWQPVTTIVAVPAEVGLESLASLNSARAPALGPLKSPRRQSPNIVGSKSRQLLVAFAAVCFLAILLSGAYELGRRQQRQEIVESVTRAFSGGITDPGHVDDARISAALADISAMTEALRTFEVDNGRYPTNDEGLAALSNPPSNLSSTWHGPYVGKPIINDPWQHPYIYRCPGAHNPRGFDLLSMGRDGKEGGNDDVDNWSPRN